MLLVHQLCHCPVSGSINSVVFSWLVSVLMIRMQISRFPRSLSVGMQTQYQTQQRLDTGLEVNWEFCGHRRERDCYVKVTLCQRGIPRLEAVTGCYSHREYVRMGVRMGGECYCEVIL